MITDHKELFSNIIDHMENNMKIIDHKVKILITNNASVIDDKENENPITAIPFPFTI